MHSDSADLKQLLTQAEAGDRGATDALLTSQRGRLKRMVSVRIDRRIAGRVDPSDVVQEVLVRAAAQLPSYLRDRPLPFYPWLRRIAWQRLVDLHRHHIGSAKRSVLREQQVQLHEQSTAQLVTHLMASQSSPSANAIRQEVYDRVKKALEALSNTDREILVLKYLEQLTSNEIATVMDLSRRTVQYGHRRALERLNEILNQA